MKKWGHDELQHDLASHLATDERMVWEDMQLGPSGSPRPDVYTMEKSYSSPKPRAYEIKISVSDFRSDTTGGKWQRYLDFASCVVFAVPAGLIQKADIPKGCGLIVRHADVWRTALKPTLSVPTYPREMMLKLLIDGVNRTHIGRKREYFSEYNAVQQLKKKFGERVTLCVSNLADAEQRLAQLRAITEAEREAQRVFAETAFKRARDNLEQEKADWQKHVAIAAAALGLPESTPFYEVQNALRTALKSMQESARIRELEEMIRRFDYWIEDARRIISAHNLVGPPMLDKTIK